MSAPIPTEALPVVTCKRSTLDALLGQTVDDFCQKFGSIADEHNHCAHFVSHVLQLRIPGAALCTNIVVTKETYKDRKTGFCIRVNQVFNSCSGRAYFANDTQPTTRFIVATIKGNIESKNPLKIGSHRMKHIGFLTDSDVYHYSNTNDEVVKQDVAMFRHHYGAGTVLLVCNLPGVA